MQPSTTIGFPHGGHTTSAKVFEAGKAIEDGCQELDMVVNISQVLSGNWQYVTDEIRAIVDLAHAAQRKVKVIFENCYLNDAQKIRLCQICTELKVDWVKTSTGYGTGGATFEDLKLMIDNVGPGIQVKAAGGVRDFETLVKVKELGVTRCGASRTQAMLDPCQAAIWLVPNRLPTFQGNRRLLSEFAWVSCPQLACPTWCTRLVTRIVSLAQTRPRSACPTGTQGSLAIASEPDSPVTQGHWRSFSIDGRGH